MKRTSRGFTLIELLVVIAIIALLMGLLLPALAKALGTARVRKDQGQIKGIASSYSIFAETDDKKLYPTPGNINREAMTAPAGYNGVYNGVSNAQVQGVGPVDYTVNTSSNLHSYSIGANYYGPSILISANEQNPIVVAKGDQGGDAAENPYDYSAVDIANDSYWDPDFSADISGMNNGVCHVSYANLAMCGKRLDFWSDGPSNRAILASRGPEIREAEDMTDETKFSKSPTLLLYGPTEQWEGIFVVADGSSHYANDFWLNNKQYTSRGEYTIFKDNCYMAEFTDYDNAESLGNAGGGSGDNWVVLNTASTKTDVTQVYDETLP